MFKVFGYLPKRDDLTAEQFRDYYETTHVPLVLSKTPAPLVYKRNYLSRGDAFNLHDDQINFDVVTELAFADRAGFERWLADLDNNEIADDEAMFMSREGIRICVIDEHKSFG